MDRILPANLNAGFRNCIIYGSLEKELDLDPTTLAEFNFTFDHCLLKVNEDIDTTVTSFVECIYNQDPLFVDPFDHDDYHLSAESPCIDAGVLNGLTIDLDGKPRTDGKQDIGCYEFQP